MESAPFLTLAVPRETLYTEDMRAVSDFFGFQKAIEDARFSFAFNVC